MGEDLEMREVSGGYLLVDPGTGKVPAMVVPHSSWWAVVVFQRTAMRGEHGSYPQVIPLLDAGTPEAAAHEFAEWLRREEPDRLPLAPRPVKGATADVLRYTAG